MDPASAAYWANEAYEGDWEDRLLFTSGPHQCIVTTDGDDMVIAFRGTESLRDVITSFKSSQVKCEGAKGKVHKGYHQAVWKLLPPIMPHINNHIGKIYMVGHSMGGAIAAIAGNIIEGSVESVYTFNSPKVGDATFAKHYNKNIFRFCSRNDKIQNFPHDTEEIRWHHVGCRIQLESRGHSISDILDVL